MRLLCPNLSTAKDIRHGFFTRVGGVSKGMYASLNCGPGSGDDIDYVMQNRARVAGVLNVGVNSLCTGYQVHSNKVAILDKPWVWKEAQEVDALVTRMPGIAIGVLAADCLPILMADGKARVIAAVHAGWKGAFDSVIDAAVHAMESLGASISDIIATIGPGIGQNSYEVGPEFHGRFIQQHIENTNFFMPSSWHPGHHLFDLPAYAKKRLEAVGITNINLLAHDTCLEENSFFSYRRATLRKESAYGRQISAIVLEK